MNRRNFITKTISFFAGMVGLGFLPKKAENVDVQEITILSKDMWSVYTISYDITPERWEFLGKPKTINEWHAIFKRWTSIFPFTNQYEVKLYRQNDDIAVRLDTFNGNFPEIPARIEVKNKEGKQIYWLNMDIGCWRRQEKIKKGYKMHNLTGEEVLL
jgi:hypothetical protein